MDGYIMIGTKINTKTFDKQIQYIEKQMEEIEHKIEQADMGFEVGDVDKLSAKYEKLSQQLTTLRKKQADLNKTDLADAERAMNSISDSVGGVLKKIGKWALAVFSVRTAYNAVTQASSTLAQYNDQYASNLEYIRFALSSAIAPLLEYIVSLAFKLLSYINYIAQAWFGVNLFSKASAKNFQSMDKSASNIKKSLQTAGFDEMNILSDTSTSGAGGTIAPSVDLSKMDIETPEWLKWIAENKDAILEFFTLLGLAIAGVKIAEFLSDLGLLGDGLTKFDILVKGLGIGLVLYGIIELIKDLKKYLEDPSWENFGKIIVDIGLILAGFALIIGSIPLAVASAITVILGLIISNWQKIKGWLDTASGFIDNMIENIKDWFVKNLDTIQQNFGYFGVRSNCYFCISC